MSLFHLLMLLITAIWLPVATGLYHWLSAIEERLNLLALKIARIESITSLENHK